MQNYTKDKEFAFLAKILATSQMNFKLLCHLMAEKEGVKFDDKFQELSPLLHASAKEYLKLFYPNNEAPELSDLTIDDILQ